MEIGFRLIRKELKSIDNLADDLTQSLFSPEFKERQKIRHIEEAIKLAKQNAKLKREIIEFSLDDPKFLYELKKVLDRLEL